MNEAKAVIETRGLRRVFKTRKETVEAVAGVDLKVWGGEVFGFLGPNGAGKTTTLRMLSTLLPPSGGEATVAGCDLLRQPQQVRERIGYVGQRGGSDPQVTGRVLAAYRSTPTRPDPSVLAGLTPKEHAVLALIGRGANIKPD